MRSAVFVTLTVVLSVNVTPTKLGQLVVVVPAVAVAVRLVIGPVPLI